MMLVTKHFRTCHVNMICEPNIHNRTIDISMISLLFDDASQLDRCVQQLRTKKLLTALRQSLQDKNPISHWEPLVINYTASE